MFRDNTWIVAASVALGAVGGATALGDDWNLINRFIISAEAPSNGPQ